MSPLTHTLRTLVIRALLRLLSLFSPSLRALLARLSASPGLPVPNPSTPHWLNSPSPIATHGSDAPVPEYADIVVIGSGITGTSFVRSLLDWERDNLPEGAPRSKVVMLEAREACSGATGRNGGHINPILYDQYPRLTTLYGAHIASQIIRFRLAHLPAILAAAHQEGPRVLADSQCREVDAYDVFHNSKLFEEQKSKLDMYRDALPSEGERYAVRERSKGEVDMDLQLNSKTVGYISTRAGALHPYRLVTGILSRLLEAYPTSFFLFAQTPCTSISTMTVSSPSASHSSLYKLITPRGSILTPHIIHATNGWAGHLLPGMRGKIVPARNTMSAHPNPTPPPPPIPNPFLSNTDTATANIIDSPSFNGQRAFVFYPDDNSDVFDYLTQQRLETDLDPESPTPIPSPSTYPPPAGELMLGGVFIRGNGALTELGNADDSKWDEGTGWYLSKALKRYFTFGEGKEVEHPDKEEHKVEEKDKVKEGGIDGVKVWSGVLGVSVDGQPWVGRVPEAVARRRAPRPRRSPLSTSTISRSMSMSSTLSLSGGENPKVNIDPPLAVEHEFEKEETAPSFNPHPPQGQGQEKTNGHADTDAGVLRGCGSSRPNRPDGWSGALAPPGEWIAAGYSGEGMVHAWLSGKVLAHMVLGLDSESGVTTAEKEKGNESGEIGEWFPPVYRVSEERWSRAGIEDLVAEFLGI